MRTSFEHTEKKPAVGRFGHYLSLAVPAHAKHSIHQLKPFPYRLGFQLYAAPPPAIRSRYQDAIVARYEVSMNLLDLVVQTLSVGAAARLATAGKTAIDRATKGS